MEKSKKVDLHMHSVFSDGTDGVDALLTSVKANNIQTFSLTDHDTISGCIEMMKSDMPEGVRFIPGVEFSCRIGSEKCHILGYNYDPKNEKIMAAIEQGKELRKGKLKRRIAYLEETYGINFTEEELDWLFSLKSAGKPHIADVLIAKGIANDKEDAIKNYINGCKTGSDRLDARIAINAIIAAGGIPVWAHPLGGEGEKHLTVERFQNELQDLIECGIKGLECWYSRYTKDEVEFLLKAAKDNGLLVSGGSDYHGTNKDISMGCLNADNIEVYESQLTILEQI